MLDFLITLIILILILSIIVFVHEFGHFIAAKKIGVYVHEFAVGMGPKIFSFKRKNDETIYSLRLLPLGGFTSLASDKESNPNLKDEQILENKSALKKFFVLIMGIVMNFILAIILFFINGLLYGSPISTPYVGEVLKDSPAYKAGLMEDDIIIEVEGIKVNNWDDIILETHYSEEKETFAFRVLRDKKELDIVISPEYKENEDGTKTPSFGFASKEKREYGFLNALKYGFIGTLDNARGVLKVLGKLITGKLGADNLSGPVGVFNVIDTVKETGLENIIFLTAYLSINVAIINLIPIPVFDGGRILILLIEKITKKKANPKIEEILNGIGALLLILLMIYVTLNDILKLF